MKYIIEFEDEIEAQDFIYAKERAIDRRCALDDIYQKARSLNKHGDTLEQFERGMEDIQQLAYDDDRLKSRNVWATPIFILSLTVAFLLGGLIVSLFHF